MELEFSRLVFEKKSSNIKFHQNPSTGSRVVPCGRTDGRRDLTKLIGTFRDFTHAPKNVPSPLTQFLSTRFISNQKKYMSFGWDKVSCLPCQYRNIRYLKLWKSNIDKITELKAHSCKRKTIWNVASNNIHKLHRDSWNRFNSHGHCIYCLEKTVRFVVSVSVLREREAANRHFLY